jgi:hypothetical protein
LIPKKFRNSLKIKPDDEFFLQEQKSPHDSIEDNEGLVEEQEAEEVIHQQDIDDLIHEEYPYEDEVLVSALPFDEDIQSFVPPAHQEENMVSYNPFENFDDTLFHDSRKKK